ncbi:hypothetical protein FB45DRAFT_1001197 [Roridomyces roridus]|uniref:RRM domain-containing protein n=1 Tax=Roridomyces roridus TaxID=1738132 RepID=A0AAD7C5M4_9AGAR|nr:hypothetical protein FB45DRAFT_1001197 [Roridomyces roridus]
MSSSSSSAASSASSSSRSSTPEPVPKRKRDDENDNSDSESDAEDEPDVPVLSHAEQRRQKKKEKQEKQPAKKRKLPDGSAVAVPPKRQNSVWVGNLSFKTTTENLTDFFKDVGEVTRVNMPTKAAGGPGMKPVNRGFAYVDFTTVEAKKNAIAMSEQNLFGRRLLIKDGDDFAGRPAAPGAEGADGADGPKKTTHSKSAQKILRVQKQPPAPTLFLGNLGFETTEAGIRELFDAHRLKKKSKKEEGDDEEKKPEEQWIRKVRMGTFEDSGLCKGFAFVDFTSVEHATSALINPKNHQLNGRSLVVEYASADAVRRGAPKAKREEGGGGGGDRKQRPRKEPRSSGPRAEKREKRPAMDSNVPVAAASQDADAAAPHNADSESRRKGPKSRPRPGAALALAKRESTAIVPSQGKKVVFE